MINWNTNEEIQYLKKLGYTVEKLNIDERHINRTRGLMIRKNGLFVSMVGLTHKTISNPDNSDIDVLIMFGRKELADELADIIKDQPVSVIKTPMLF